MSASAIRAGEAFVEVTIRDKLTQGINRAVAKMSVFAKTVKSLSVSEGLSGLGGALTKIGAVLAGAGGGITAIMAKSASVFMEVARYAKDIGQSLNAIDAARAEKLSLAWNTLRATFTAVQFAVGSAIAEPLTVLLSLATGLLIKFSQWVRQNQELVVKIAAVGAIALVAGTAIIALGAAFVLAGSSLAAVVAGFTALFTPVGAVIAIIAATAAAVLLASGAFIMFSEVGRQSIDGIASSLATSDVATSWKIICKAMEVMWDAVWVSIKIAMLSAFSFIFAEMEKATRKMSEFVGGIEVGLGVLLGKKLNFGSGVLGSGANLLGGLATATNVGGGADLQATVAELLRDLAGLSGLNEGAKKNLRLKLSGLFDFNSQVGATNETGSSVGTFSGRGAGLLGVGPGGGQKVTDDKTHEILERAIKAIKGIDAGVEFK